MERQAKEEARRQKQQEQQRAKEEAKRQAKGKGPAFGFLRRVYQRSNSSLRELCSSCVCQGPESP